MRWFLALALFSVLSCAEKNPPTRKMTFNCDSLIDSHIIALTKVASSLEKISTVNARASTSLINGNMNWKNELEPFRALSLINKPVYSGSYSIKINPDEKSNLTVKTWQAISDIPVRNIKLFYLKNPTQIKRMEATVVQSNFVYSSTKNLILDFTVLGNNPRPERYEISGTQKFFWGAPQYYSLEGLITVK